MASAEQRELMKAFEGATSFEFMRSDEVMAADPARFAYLWDYNIQWMRDMVQESDSIIDDYKNRHMDAILDRDRVARNKSQGGI